MALIKCPECGKEVSDKAKVCIHCGYPLTVENIESQEIEESMYCPYCGKKLPPGSEFCAYCGRSFDGTPNTSLILQRQTTPVISVEKKDIISIKENIDGYGSIEAIQREQLAQQQKILEQQCKQQELMAKCPKCGSTSLSANRKGFGVGKAIVGTALLGGVGLLAGEIGSNKTIVTCINCGYKFTL